MPYELHDWVKSLHPFNVLFIEVKPLSRNPLFLKPMV